MSDTETILSQNLNCEQCKELLSAHIDRELSPEQQRAVERHLGACAKCGKESTYIHGIKRIAQHWEGVRGSGEWRKNVVEEFVRESRLMPSGPFTDAAQSARDEGVPKDQTQERLSPGWIIGIATAVAMVAYVLIRMLRG